MHRLIVENCAALSHCIFDYVVAQEQAQLEASQIAKEEGWLQGC
ncbi:hypothetical protein N9D72_03220 [Porticoccaceae bacterium]|nr:hypothetical protein [Porticoccaceae bacterium]